MISMSKSFSKHIQTIHMLFDTTAKIQRTLKDWSSQSQDKILASDMASKQQHNWG